jgi:hypothetical protein
MQVYTTFGVVWNVTFIGLAALFAVRVNKTLVRFGWI